MSFLVSAALALGLFVVLPAVAHLLRRGRAAEQPFPPAALVPAATTLARRERRFEDKLLFLVRALAVLVLAVLGATPFVQCSRLSLARGSGGSLALALVIDDSLSMRARPPGGETRWERSLRAARDLLDSTREGDAVAIVLAGRPARAVLGTTTDLALARRTLGELRPSDRGTDLPGAVALARASLSGGERHERRIVLLSDHAGTPAPGGTPAVSSPVPELSQLADDCGVVAAERRGSRVLATIACNRPEAARRRTLEVVALAGSGLEPSEQARALAIDAKQASGSVALASAAIEPRVGVQSVSLVVAAKERALAVRLTGEDALARDDAAPVGPEESALGVGVVADTARSGVETGGATLLEQALGALEAEVVLRPLGVLPDRASELAAFGLLLLDDPAGIGPEARAALGEWIEPGGLAVALLGPRVESTELGATLEPFASGAPRWERNPPARGADVASLGWLGPEAAGLAELGARGRTLIDVGSLRDARVIGRFSDGAPFVVERRVGRGAVATILLPSSTTESDFALRPGFVALIDHFLAEAKRQRGLRRTVVGASWVFGPVRPRVFGPEGPLDVQESVNEGRVASPSLLGLYRVVEQRGEELRTATLEAEEITALPQPPAVREAGELSAGGERGVDASREFAMLLGLVLALELALRAARTLRRGRAPGTAVKTGSR